MKNWDTNEVKLIITNDESMYDLIISGFESAKDIFGLFKESMFSHVDECNVDFDSLQAELDEIKREVENEETA